MNKKIEITLPPVNVNKEEQDIKIRQMLTYDKNEKEGTLSQVMVFAQMYGPLSITNLTNKMELYFRKEIERANVSRAVDKLVKLGLMMRVTSGDVLFMPEDEKDEIHKEVDRIHRNFLQRIAQAFRNNYSKVNYIWVANGDGIKYIDLCCKLNGFDYKEK